MERDFVEVMFSCRTYDRIGKRKLLARINISPAKPYIVKQDFKKPK